MTGVVGIHGQYVPMDGEADQDVVACLETMLRDARAGHLHALAVVYDTPTGVRYRVVGYAIGFDLLGGIEVAKDEIIRQLLSSQGD